MALSKVISVVFFALAASVTTNAADYAPSAEEVRPLLVGTSAPETSLQQLDGKSKKLKDILDGKPTIVIFYRGGWCPYCNLHLGELQSIEDQIKKLGVQIIAISPDKASELKKSTEKNKLKYQLYSDSKMSAAKAFGIAFKVDEATVKKYKTFKIDLAAASGESHHLLPVPSVFAISKKGIIEYTYVNPTYQSRISANVLMAVVKELAK